MTIKDICIGLLQDFSSKAGIKKACIVTGFKIKKSLMINIKSL